MLSQAICLPTINSIATTAGRTWAIWTIVHSIIRCSKILRMIVGIYQTSWPLQTRLRLKIRKRKSVERTKRRKRRSLRKREVQILNKQTLIRLLVGYHAVTILVQIELLRNPTLHIAISKILLQIKMILIVIKKTVLTILSSKRTWNNSRCVWCSVTRASVQLWATAEHHLES